VLGGERDRRGPCGCVYVCVGGIGVSVKGWDEKVIIVPINVLYVSCIMCVTLYF